MNSHWPSLQLMIGHGRQKTTPPIWGNFNYSFKISLQTPISNNIVKLCIQSRRIGRSLTSLVGLKHKVRGGQS